MKYLRLCHYDSFSISEVFLEVQYLNEAGS